MAATQAVGRRVLLVENQAAIAVDLADELERAGYTVAGPFSRCDRSMEWLQSNTPDLALLDLLLADGSCTEVARELRKRGVPFVVFSGDAAELGPNLVEAIRGAPIVGKPGHVDMALAALKILRGMSLSRLHCGGGAWPEPPDSPPRRARRPQCRAWRRTARRGHQILAPDVGPAGGEHNGDVGVQLAGVLRDLSAAYGSGKIDVGDQHIDGRNLLEQCERILAARWR